MRNTFLILITLAFIAVLSVNKVTAYECNSSISLVHKNSNVTYTQKEIISHSKDNSSVLNFEQYTETSNEDVLDEVENFNNTKGFLPLNFLLKQNAIPFAPVSTLLKNQKYLGLYDTIIRVPLYILNHALILPFS
ncbi:hypothetical protein [Flavobacterium sp. FlaQc-47]|uniref:hypothetical protein n=1 Tax=Flavobacterium sp. FlaQc-47 TaxID=3374180 RepID=UPI003758457B